MKPFDFSGEVPSRSWFRQIQEILTRGISLDDNLDAVIATGYVGTVETEIGHALGRVPRVVIPVGVFPYGTTTITFTRAPEAGKLWLSGGVAGVRAFLLM